MAYLQQELGTYDGRDMVRIYGSFQADGANNPDLMRDGKKNQITAVRTSLGLYTVTIAGNFPIPERLIFESANLSVASTVAKAQNANIVARSYSQVTRTFQVVITTVGDVALSAYADPALSDPNDNDRINFELIGSISSAGTDAA